MTFETLRVFISYARRDGAIFAEELLVGLEVAGFEPFLDREDIAAGEDWEQRLSGLIQASDTVVFVISPGAVESERCVWELEQANLLSKRILPVVIATVPEANVPPKLQRLNYIFFDHGKSFARALSQLAIALRTDINWIREHTRLAELAMRWRDRDKSESLLLRGPELDVAKAWMTSWSGGVPEPTELHRMFVAESDNVEQRRASLESARLAEIETAQNARADALQRLSRRTTIGLITASGLTAGAGALAYWGVNAEDRFNQERRAKTEVFARLARGTLTPEEAARLADEIVTVQFTAGIENPEVSQARDAILRLVSSPYSNIRSATGTLSQVQDDSAFLTLERAVATTGDRSAIRDLSKIALPTDLAISRNSPLSRLYQHLNEDAGKIKIEMMQAPSRDRSTWRPLAGTKVIVGTVMGFRVTSPVAGNLILLDRLPEGELQLITPEAVPVIAGQTITLPLDENSAVQVSPPLGQEALIAVVVPGDVKLKSLSALSEATESSQFSIFGATAFTDEIVGVLDQRQNLRNDFGFGFFSFEIRLA